MLSRSVRRRFSANWASLQEFAIKDADSTAFRNARTLSAEVTNAVSDASGAAKSSVDWSKYQNSIKHTELVGMLKAYHDQQLQQLDGLLKEDHAAECGKAHSASWDSVYNEEMVQTAENAVTKSEDIVANGAKALYISSNNPSVSEVGTSEWLDTDQYWAAYVEKHQHYHDHINVIGPDPESKEYHAFLAAEHKQKLNFVDDECHAKHMGSIMYQKNSYEHYNFYKGVLAEHMAYYLVKVGGCKHTFPELPPHSWMKDIYDKKFRVFNVLQTRKRAAQEKLLARSMDWEFMPHDPVGGGEAYYTKLCGQQSALVEATVARLMGDFCFLSDAVPAQTSAALSAVEKSAGSGQWYSLGDDVNALFYKSDSAGSVSASSPKAAVSNYVSYLETNQQYLHPVFKELGSIFGELLEERKGALSGGSWFNCPEESSADAFLRRLSKEDPLYSVYQSYCTELSDKWDKEKNENFKQLSGEEAKKAIKDIEARYVENVKIWKESLREHAASDGGTAAEGKSRMEAVAAAAAGKSAEGVTNKVAYGVALTEK